ncbi:hypothetical protein LZ554_009166 [Drepanopeziza brunnea f. sp. 'monogermtubi']|nr:hypothetical protein LZ554_009166 [Drepanopeziza brunnea f. sp. 'monogermtubi']
MKLSAYASIVATIASLTEALPTESSLASRALPLVESNKLRRVLLRSELLKKGQLLQDFAYAWEGRNRYSGTPGHQSTIDYIQESLNATGYYDTYTQEFIVPSTSGALSVAGAPIQAAPMSFSPAGNITAQVVAVANLGCDAADYPAAVSGAIALISRGTCTFGAKSTLAKAAGAVGAIIYNNIPDTLLQGTLGEAGDYAPTLGTTQEDGLALAASLPMASLEVQVINTVTYNVIAQTKGGDSENVLMVGSHTDSVEAGPGINDNGSGTIGILEVALQLAKFSTNNAVRFGWWSGEEDGLLGAEHYVAELPQEERDKIRIYLNFDMIASPNFVYEIYDGDGSAFNISGAPGSAEAEKLWEDYFKNEVAIPTNPSAFDGRSDYGPFLDVGIAAGGLTSGADGVKTQEDYDKYGGVIGAIYDPNYHTAQDTVENTNVGVWIGITKGIAHAVATYGRSWDSFPAQTKRSAPVKKRDLGFQRKGNKLLW